MTRLAVLLDNALRDPDPRSGIARAKQIIRGRLLETEPGAEIYETDYFDHSFAPDLLLRPRGGNAGSERWVFLRTTNDPDELADDLEVVPKNDTLFVSLDRFRTAEPGRQSITELDRASARHGSLVLDAPALEKVGNVEVRSTTAALMTQALINTGRGALGEPETVQELAAFAGGFAVIDHTYISKRIVASGRRNPSRSRSPT